MWLNLACFVGGLGVFGVGLMVQRRSRRYRGQWIAYRLQDFFKTNDPAALEVRRRTFPAHVAPDVKAGIDAWLGQQQAPVTLLGVPMATSYMESVSIGVLLAPRDTTWYQPGAVEYTSYDIGGDRTVECPQHALWLVDPEGAKLAVFWTTELAHSGRGFVTKLKVEVAHLLGGKGDEAAARLFENIETAVRESQAYRGKVLSLEERDDYAGNAGGICVHRLKQVGRDDVVLPDATIKLLERNLLRFAEQRDSLRKLNMPTKKGLLLYGPPGTGKTHTIHYLVGSLAGHTTLLITAEQIGRLDEYMTLARLFQPCLVVIEDVDLIAKSRDESDVCQQSLLNRLLNEMDGLREDADIIFVLTTNRPHMLEEALASRPGRVDQAIDFPLPHAQCRERLVRLYACGANIAPDVVAATVRSTEGVSASFIKELMRRAIQFHLECHPNSTPEILRNDIDQALDELLCAGSPLNRLLLGAGDVPTGDVT